MDRREKQVMIAGGNLSVKFFTSINQQFLQVLDFTVIFKLCY